MLLFVDVEGPAHCLDGFLVATHACRTQHPPMSVSEKQKHVFDGFAVTRLAAVNQSGVPDVRFDLLYCLNLCHNTLCQSSWAQSRTSSLRGLGINVETVYPARAACHRKPCLLLTWQGPPCSQKPLGGVECNHATCLVTPRITAMSLVNNDVHRFSSLIITQWHLPTIDFVKGVVEWVL